jgi:non-ribosomal peptide synthetase component F
VDTLEDRQSRLSSTEGGESSPRPVVVDFTQNADKHPERIALVDLENQEYSYGELNLRANRLANTLLAKRGKKEAPMACFPCSSSAPFLRFGKRWQRAELL